MGTNNLNNTKLLFDQSFETKFLNFKIQKIILLLFLLISNTSIPACENDTNTTYYHLNLQFYANITESELWIWDSSFTLCIAENNIQNSAIKPITKHNNFQKDKTKHIIKKNNIPLNKHQIKDIQMRNQQYEFLTSFLGLINITNSKNYIGSYNRFILHGFIL